MGTPRLFGAQEMPAYCANGLMSNFCAGGGTGYGNAAGALQSIPYGTDFK
jgi:hypothetical protein